MQLSLPVRLNDSATFDNFYLPAGSPNIMVLSALKARLGSDSNLGVSNIFLWGRAGSGLSHLLQAYCHKAALANTTAIYLPLDRLNDESPSVVFEGLEKSVKIICIDGIDSVIRDKEWAEQLFHLYNRCIDSDVQLLVTSYCSPASLDVPLADLKSRLSAMEVYQVQELNDDEIAQALILRSKLRGMEMPEKVAQYLLTWQARSLATQFELLDKLDKATLAEKRLLTIPFVKQVIASISDE